MIRSYFNQTEQRNGRISQKTLDHTFLHMIQNGANCPPFVSKAILDTAKKVYRINEADGRYTMKERLDEITGKAQNFVNLITEARSRNEQNKKKNTGARL